MKNKLIRIITGTMLVLVFGFTLSCSKSTDTVQDEQLSAAPAVATPSDANLGAASSGRGR